MSEEKHEINEPEHIILAGKTIRDEIVTVDGGKVCGCTIEEKGLVTVTSQVSFVTDCIIEKDGILTVAEGMVMDCSVHPGGRLNLYQNVVYQNVIVQNDGIVYAPSKDGLILGEKAQYHDISEIYASGQSLDAITKEIMDSDHGRDNGEEFDQDVDHNPQLDGIPNKDKIDEKIGQDIDSLQDMLAEDAKNKQFTEGACGKKECKEPTGDNMLVDDNNRTRLYIEGVCNYEDVVGDINSFVFQYGDHRFIVSTALGDDCFDDGDDTADKVRIYIRHMPRLKGVKDYDIALVDVLFSSSAPDDMRFGVESIDYEDIKVDIDLDEDHDVHVYEKEEQLGDCTSTIILEGSVYGRPSCDWNKGNMVVSYHGVKYQVNTDRPSERSLFTDDHLKFKMRLYPKNLSALAGNTIITDPDETTRILHECEFIDFIDGDDNALLSFESCNIDGRYIKIKIPWQDVRIQIDGFTTDEPVIWESVIATSRLTGNDPFTIVDSVNDRLVFYDNGQHAFTVIMTPRCIITKNGTMCSGLHMYETLKTCILTGLKITDDAKGKIEINAFYVDKQRHNINLTEKNDHYKLFTYTKPSEDKVVKKQVTVPQTNEQPKTQNLVLVGSYKYLVPMFRLSLEIEDESRGTQRYTLWSEHTDVDYDDSEGVEFKFFATVFNCNGKKIAHPIDLNGKKYKFRVDVLCTNAIGEFKPKKLYWGGLEYNFD